MSTIAVDNVKPSAGGTAFSTRGVAKAWVNFDGTGTIAARDSENVTSLTDNGTGDYTVNFTNTFDVADYAISGTSLGGNVTGPKNAAGVLTGSVNVLSYFSVNSDVAVLSVVIHGDLA